METESPLRTGKIERMGFHFKLSLINIAVQEREVYHGSPQTPHSHNVHFEKSLPCIYTDTLSSARAGPSGRIFQLSTPEYPSKKGCVTSWKKLTLLGIEDQKLLVSKVTPLLREGED